MNRLFEALGEMEADLPLSKGLPREEAPDNGIQVNLRTVIVPEPISAEEVKIEQLSPEAVLADLTSSEVAPTVSVRDAELQQSSQETIPFDVFLPSQDSSVLAQEAKAEPLSPDTFFPDLTPSESYAPIFEQAAETLLFFHEAIPKDAPLPDQAPAIPLQEMETEQLLPETLSPDVFPFMVDPPMFMLDAEAQPLSLEAVPLEISLPNQAPTILAQEAETEQLSPDTASPEVSPSEVHPPVPVQAAEAQPPSQEALSPETSQSNPVPPDGLVVQTHASKPMQERAVAKNVQPKSAKTGSPRPASLRVPPESRLVALTDPNSLGAEKFRALVTRLEHLHERDGLKCLQVTSSVINEGKTLVSANVAVTLAKHFGSKTLLIEGDLHRPTLGKIFGLNKMSGVSHWWSSRDQELDPFVHKLDDLPLWFLPAGIPCDRASDILRSSRFVKAFEQLASQFEWIVVDSTPMLPIVDVNLWSRLVDGTLLVVREGVTPVKALKQGLLALNHPNLIGVVLNEACATSDAKYNRQYYGSANR
jgi:protein-tyrosine kinase